MKNLKLMNKNSFCFASTEYPFTKTIENVQNVCCIYFPKDLFVTNAVTFKDVKNFATKKIHLQALMIYAHLIDNIILCDIRGDESIPLEGDRVSVGRRPGKVKRDNGDETYLVEFADGEAITCAKDELVVSVRASPSNKHFFECNDLEEEENDADVHARARVLPRTEHILEYVHSKDGKTREGIRFWFFVLDKTIDFGKGIMKLIENNQELVKVHRDMELKRGAAPSIKFKPWESYMFMRSLDLWAFGLCDAYNGTSNCQKQDTVVFNPNKTLRSASNPANPYTVFSPTNAFNAVQKFDEDKDTVLTTQKYLCQYKVGADKWSFPEPHLAFRLKHNWVHPRLLYLTTFPSIRVPTTTREGPENGFMDIGQDQSYNPGVMDMLYARSNHDAEGEDENMSDMKKCAIFNNHLLNKINIERLDLNGHPFQPKDYPAVMERYKQRAVSDFNKVWHEDSQLSVNSKVMLEWMTARRRVKYDNGDVFNMCSPGYTYDRELSVFGNLVVRRISGFEHFLQVSTVHRELFLIKIYGLDAYRRHFGLHSNFILAGQGASSKSFMLDCTVKCSIDKTVQTVTHQTAKANAIDDDQNDTVTLFHELPPTLLGLDVKPGTNDTGDALIKEQLTSCMFKTKTFVRDEITGKRSNRVASSECIGIIGGCTNDAARKMPEALASRFHIIMCPKNTRAGREVNQLQGVVLPQETKQMKKKFIESCHKEQFLVCEIEKMIWTRVIHDVNMNIALKLFNQALDYLYDKGICDAKQPRHFIRLINTARTLTIMNAIEILFNRSDEMKGEFSVEQVVQVEPYLVCTEEIAYFTLSLLQDMFINPIRPYVVEVIAKHFCNYTSSKCVGAMYADETQPNYLVWGTTILQAAHSINQNMRKMVSSPNNIAFVLDNLRSNNITVKKREGTSPTTELSTTHTIPILRVEMKPFPKLYLSTAFVDKIVFQNNKKNLMQEAIRSTFHKCSRPRKIILGESLLAEKNMPQFLKTMEVTRGKKYMTIRNTNYTNHADSSVLSAKAAKNCELPAYIVDGDLEEIEFRRHWKDCGFEPESFNEQVLPVETEKHLAVPHSLSYPDDYVKEYSIQKNIIKNITHNQEEKIARGQFLYSSCTGRQMIIRRPKQSKRKRTAEADHGAAPKSAKHTQNPNISLNISLYQHIFN
jgi:hypothetical protein